eukprot:jgi/Mesvir1/10392/Mv02353-RA.1
MLTNQDASGGDVSTSTGPLNLRSKTGRINVASTSFDESAISTGNGALSLDATTSVNVKKTLKLSNSTNDAGDVTTINGPLNLSGNSGVVNVAAVKVEGSAISTISTGTSANAPNFADPKGFLYFKNVHTESLVATSDDRTQSSAIRLLTDEDGKTLLLRDGPGLDPATSPAIIFDNNGVSIRSGGNVINVSTTGITGVGGGGNADSASVAVITGPKNTKYRFQVNDREELEVVKFEDNQQVKTVMQLF